MTPLENYQQAIASGQFYPDARQQEIIHQLQAVYNTWMAQHNSNNKSIWQRLLQSKRNHPVKGMYLWGGVGAGKTWLMDLFYNAIPEEFKLRLHFHRFMQRIHHELKQLQGQVNPVQLIAKRFAQQVKLIFLDEFVVNDITDAMLLANLLDALFAEGVTLMATSNVPPEGLYRNGLQRGRFLPAIALLNKHLQVVHSQVQADYRLRTLEEAGVYFYPLNAEAEQQLLTHYQHLVHGTTKLDKELMIEGRSIPIVRCSHEVVWFDFNIICNVPRSQLDYVEIARSYNTVILSNVPIIQPEQDATITYFINLIDVFYDARVKLIISAAGTVDELYTAGRYSFEFQRTRSRLLEMQSKEYISCAHLG